MCVHVVLFMGIQDNNISTVFKLQLIFGNFKHMSTLFILLSSNTLSKNAVLFYCF